MKQFTIPCDFSGSIIPVTFYIGSPEPSHHPIGHQSKWLGSVKGGQVPADLMDTLQKLHDLALDNGANFEELCYYALISSTQNHSSRDANDYAQEYLKKEKEGDLERIKETINNANNSTVETTTVSTKEKIDLNVTDDDLLGESTDESDPIENDQISDDTLNDDSVQEVEIIKDQNFESNISDESIIENDNLSDFSDDLWGNDNSNFIDTSTNEKSDVKNSIYSDEDDDLL